MEKENTELQSKLLIGKKPTTCGKETTTHVFSSEFCKIFKNTFFTEHLQTTASDIISFLNTS